MITIMGAIALSAAAHAEVQKYMNITDGKLVPAFLLVATPPDGWVLEEQTSKERGVQMFVPKAQTFRNADVLMYVRVSYKQKDLELPQFIANSQKRWRNVHPDTKITKMPEVVRKNGKAAFLPYQYENPSVREQPFEYVAFAEDGDKDGNTFTLMVALTGGGRKAIEKATPAYNAFLRAH